MWKGWEDRVNADPQFVYKVLVEQVIGVGASVIGDMASRPNWGLNELDFVFATLVVGSIVNFALMYLLAPTGVAGAAAGGGLIAKLFSEQTLISLGAPGQQGCVGRTTACVGGFMRASRARRHPHSAIFANGAPSACSPSPPGPPHHHH